MASTRYDILFSGELIPGAERELVRAQIQERFKLSDQAAEKLFSGRTIAIKRDLNSDRAVRFREAFLQAGARVQLVARTAESAAEPETGAMDQSPDAVTGDGGLSLAPADGRPLEAEPETEPPDIDVSRLSLVPGKDWTLEDCGPPVPPVPVPDTSHLGIVEPEPADGRPLGPDES